jgi:hypothetical protein
MTMTKTLDTILLERHLKHGLRLEEDSDVFLMLKLGDKSIAYFSQKTVVSEIHKAADKWLMDNDLWS